MGPRTKHPGKKGNKVHTERTKVGLSDRHNTQRPPDSSGDHWTKKTKLATTRGCTMSEKRPVRKEGSHGTAAQGSDHVLITFNEPNALAKISGPRRGRVAIQTSRGTRGKRSPNRHDLATLTDKPMLANRVRTSGSSRDSWSRFRNRRMASSMNHKAQSNSLSAWKAGSSPRWRHEEASSWNRPATTRPKRVGLWLPPCWVPRRWDHHQTQSKSWKRKWCVRNQHSRTLGSGRRPVVHHVAQKRIDEQGIESPREIKLDKQSRILKSCAFLRRVIT